MLSEADRSVVNKDASRSRLNITNNSRVSKKPFEEDWTETIHNQSGN